jgi:hypothetical protein
MAGKPRARRNKETQELEPPWANIRRQWAASDPVEVDKAQQRAQQLIEGGYGAINWADSSGLRG